MKCQQNQSLPITVIVSWCVSLVICASFIVCFNFLWKGVCGCEITIRMATTAQWFKLNEEGPSHCVPVLSDFEAHADVVVAPRGIHEHWKLPLCTLWCNGAEPASSVITLSYSALKSEARVSSIVEGKSLKGTLKWNSESASIDEELHSDKSNVVDITTIGILIEKIKVIVSWWNLCTWRLHRLQSIIFCFLATLARNFLKLGTLSLWASQRTVYSFLPMWNYVWPRRLRHNLRCHGVWCGNLKAVAICTFSFRAFSLLPSVFSW